MQKDTAIGVIWDYMQLGHVLQPADCIFLLGSNDDRVAQHAANLWHNGLTPWLVISGDGTKHQSELLRDTYGGQTEAAVMEQIVLAAGIPESVIIIENNANNTGENFSFTRPLLDELNIPTNQVIVVQKPYMERRSYATGKMQWPESELILSSPPFTDLDSYVADKFDRDEIINIMVGDLERIKVYPAKGFQIPQEIPDDVWKSFEYLVNEGYTQHLLKNI